VLRTAVSLVLMFVVNSRTASPFEHQTLEGKLSLSLTSSRLSFVAGEMIYLNAIIENTTDEILIIEDPIEYGVLRMRILDEKNTFVDRFVSDSRLPGLPPRATLRPHQKRNVQVDFKWFGNGSTMTGGVRDFLPGVYRVWVEYDGIKSNLVEIAIQGRSTAEEAIRLKIEHAVKLTTLNAEQAVRECQDLLKSEPSSLFTPNVYSLMLFYLHASGRYQEAMMAALDFIQRYPNHGAVEYAVNYYQKSLIDSKPSSPDGLPSPVAIGQANSELQKIAAQYPDSKEIAFAVEYYSQRAQRSLLVRKMK